MFYRNASISFSLSKDAGGGRATNVKIKNTEDSHVRFNVWNKTIFRSTPLSGWLLPKTNELGISSHCFSSLMVP